MVSRACEWYGFKGALRGAAPCSALAIAGVRGGDPLRCRPPRLRFARLADPAPYARSHIAECAMRPGRGEPDENTAEQRVRTGDGIAPWRGTAGLPRERYEARTGRPVPPRVAHQLSLLRVLPCSSDECEKRDRCGEHHLARGWHDECVGQR